jgi:hypothetical protein
LPTWILPKLTLSGLAARRLPLVEAEVATLPANIRKSEIANTTIGSREIRRGNDMDMNCEPSSAGIVGLGRAFPNSWVLRQSSNDKDTIQKSSSGFANSSGWNEIPDLVVSPRTVRNSATGRPRRRRSDFTRGSVTCSPPGLLASDLSGRDWGCRWVS